MKCLVLFTAVNLLLVEADKPTVKMMPPYRSLYWGDRVSLKCSGQPVSWIRNGVEIQPPSHQMFVLPALSAKDSGSYQCRTNEESDPINITVQNHLPKAFLTLLSKNAVFIRNDTASVKLFVDKDLKEWGCYIVRDNKRYRLNIPEERMRENSVQFAVEVKSSTPEIVWCRNKMERSNSLILRNTDLAVMLEVPPCPVMVGEAVTLTCEVPGGAKFDSVVFLKDGDEVARGINDTVQDLKIAHANASHEGDYSCRASFFYTYVIPHGDLKEDMPSDPQTLNVRESAAKAKINVEKPSLRCSCAMCPTFKTSYWYHRESSTADLTRFYTDRVTFDPTESGQYACQASWANGTSLLSTFVAFRKSDKPPLNVFAIVMVLGMLLGVLLLLLFGVPVFMYFIQRQDTSAQQNISMTGIWRRRGTEDDYVDPDTVRPVNTSS